MEALIPARCKTAKIHRIEHTIGSLGQLINLNYFFLQDIEYIDSCNGSIFPTIEQCHQEVSSWQWIYGKTPKFTVSHIVTFLRSLGSQHFFRK